MVRCWTLVLALLVLGPALGPGYVLTYDMVFVPDPSFSATTLGVGPGLPRAVPQDAVVTALTALVPAVLLQKAILLGTLVGAGLGAARLLPADAVVARLVAATVAVWNPYVAERLVLGHWGLLVSYAALFWLVGATRAWRHGGRLWPVLIPLGLCALTPTGGALGLLALVVVALTTPGAGPQQRSDVGRLAAAAAAVNAPWVLTGVLRAGATRSDAGGVEAFASREEVPGGVLPSLLGLGGVWNADVVPDSRATVFGMLSVSLLLVLTAVGVRRGAAQRDELLRPLLVLGAVGLGLALLGSLPGTTQLLEWAVSTVPGAGLLRDGHKWVALLAPLLAWAAGTGAAYLAARLGPGLAATTLGVGTALLVVALLPDLAWGVGGRLDAVDYPRAWQDARVRLVADDPDPDVVVLPLSAFRSYEWNGERTVLDPAPRFFPGDVVGDDRLTVGDVTLDGEDRRAARVRRAVARSGLDVDWLRRAGFTHVLVQTDQPGADAGFAGTVRLVRRHGLDLFRVPGPVASPPGPHPVRVGVSIAAHLVAVGVVLGAGLTGLSGRVRGQALIRRRRRT